VCDHPLALQYVVAEHFSVPIGLVAQVSGTEETGSGCVIETMTFLFGVMLRRCDVFDQRDILHRHVTKRATVI
jgi:hypothetical protein